MTQSDPQKVDIYQGLEETKRQMYAECLEEDQRQLLGLLELISFQNQCQKSTKQLRFDFPFKIYRLNVDLLFFPLSQSINCLGVTFPENEMRRNLKSFTTKLYSFYFHYFHSCSLKNPAFKFLFQRSKIIRATLFKLKSYLLLQLKEKTYHEHLNHLRQA